jgi:hypothetical protein
MSAMVLNTQVGCALIAMSDCKSEQTTGRGLQNKWEQFGEPVTSFFSH